MKKKCLSYFKNFIRKYNLHAFREVAIFAIITIIIHFSWRFWAYQLHYAPIHDVIYKAFDFMSKQVFLESSWFVSHVLNINITIVKQTMYFPNIGYIEINAGCSGLKQFTQFALLMILYPGPWKKKLWFIPLGVFIVHLTNLFRVIGLSVVIINWTDYWKFSHDYLFRPFFYVVIFSMWVIWVEKISKKKTKKNEEK